MPTHVFLQDLAQPHASVRNFVYFRWLSPRSAKHLLDLGLRSHLTSNQHLLGLCIIDGTDGGCFPGGQHHWAVKRRWYVARLRGQEWSMASFRPGFNWMQRTNRPISRAQRMPATTRLLGRRLFYKRRWRT